MTDRLRALPWWMRSSVAAAAGVLASTGFAPLGWWPMLIVAVAAFTLLARTAPRAWQAALAGLCYGLGLYLVAIRWLSVIFVEAMLGLAALESCFLALLAVLVRLAGRARAWPLLAAGSWVLIEYLFGHYPFGGFPWLRLGYAVIDSPLAGLLPLVGVPGAGFALALVAQVLAWTVLHRGSAAGGADRWRRRAVGLAGAAAVLATGTLGLLVQPGAELGSVSVGYVQGNAAGGGVYGIGPPRSITAKHLAETQRLAARVQSGELPRPDFVVWPENGTDLDPFRDAQTGQAVRTAVAAVGVPLVLGTITEGPGPRERQTAAIVWDPQTGAQARYHKRDLVPFGEWVPLRGLLEPLFPVVAYVGAQSIPGTGPGVLDVRLPDRTVPVGVLICYEVAFDATVHDTVTGGGQLNIVQSSNAMYVGTAQVPQQFAITRARAMELRRDLLVVTTTGISGLIRPDGSVAFQLPEFTNASGVAEVPLRDSVTPAAAYSGILELAGIAVTAIALGWTAWRRRAVSSGAGATAGVRQNGSVVPNQEQP